MDDLNKKIEKKMEQFSDATPGIKNPGPYAKKHEDMAAAGNANDQEELDDIDATEDKFQKPVKKPSDQFPGVKMTDKKLTTESGPEAFHKEMEKKMSEDKKLAGNSDKLNNAFSHAEQSIDDCIIDLKRALSDGLVAAEKSSDVDGIVKAIALVKQAKAAL